MSVLQDRYPTTVYKTQAEADRLAKICGGDDPDCEYRVEKRAKGWVVALYDADGYELGVL